MLTREPFSGLLHPHPTTSAGIIGHPIDLPDQKPEIILKKRHSALMRFRIARRVLGALSDPPRHPKPFERFKEGVSGQLPAVGPGGIILAACDDYYYRNFAGTLVRSVERQGATERVHLHLCAPSAESLRDIEQVASSLRHVSLSWTVDDCRLAQNLRYRTVYYAASRFLIAPLLLEATGAPLLCIDVDGMAVRPIWQNYEQVREGADILVTRRFEEAKPTRKILAGAVGINPTPAGRRFAAALGRSLASILALRPAYHVDQIAIYYLLTELSTKGGLHVKDMPRSYVDFEFAEGSVIWTPKGWAGKSSQTYLAARAEIVDAGSSEPRRDPD